MITVIVGGAAALLVIWIGLLLWSARSLVAYWREPVFKTPVLVLESDDWGPAPPEHAGILSAIAALLRETRDRNGRPPVMTLGVVLAIPEVGSEPTETPRELTMLDPRFHPIVDAMQAGVRDGVFQIHLHGRSHYWLDALASARHSDTTVAQWLASPETWRTEALPPGLQSRWGPEIEGQPFLIPAETLRAAAEEEARLFRACFGSPAVVAVPTTFVWNPAIERGWAAAGIRAIVTPGRYYRDRGEFADPGSVPLITNGMSSEGIRYVVRDRYFEPFKGHSAEHGLSALAANTALGRPTLLETHRANFLSPALRERSFSAIRELLAGTLAAYPDIRFLSTVELVDAIATSSSDLIDRSFSARIATWCRRIRTLGRFWRLARLSGLAFVITGAERLARQSR